MQYNNGSIWFKHNIYICYTRGVPEALPDLGQLSESDRESLVLDLWTRLR